MGRHSAPDEAEVEAAERAAGTAGAQASGVALDLGARRGRHDRGDADGDDSHTLQMTVISDASIEDRHDTDVIVPFEAPPAEPAPGADKKARKEEEKARKAQEKERAKAAAAPSGQPGDKAAAKAQRKAERKDRRRESGTRADLRMLRRNGAARAQALAAVIVSFLLYTVVMVVIGASDVYLLWLWIPIVASGVLVGVVLDLAHRRATRPPPS